MYVLVRLRGDFPVMGGLKRQSSQYSAETVPWLRRGGVFFSFVVLLACSSSLSVSVFVVVTPSCPL